MEFGHHPEPADDFCTEVEAIEAEIVDRAAGLPATMNLGARIERAMQFNVGGSAQAVVAKHDLRKIAAAFQAGAQIVEREEKSVPTDGDLEWWAMLENIPLAAARLEHASVAPRKYDDVLQPFLALMRRELHANTRKGDRPGWLAMDANTLLLEVYWHTAKLSAAVKNNDGPAIMEHSADVANMAMMVLDRCGGLAWVEHEPRAAADPAERAAAETREALTAIRTRLQNGVNWMMEGRNTGNGIGVADMRALIHFIDARLEADPDDEAFDLFVARAACGNLGALVDMLREELQALKARTAAPIDMLLFCPTCHAQHVDEPDERTPGWSNPPHRSHLCHACETVWRPADVPTNGVRTVATRGKGDNWPGPKAPARFPSLDTEAAILARVAAAVPAPHDAALCDVATRLRIRGASPVRAFAQEVAQQKPERTDYLGGTCGQCARNIEEAEDALAKSARADAKAARPPSDAEPWVVADDTGLRLTFTDENAAWRYRDENTGRLVNPTVTHEPASAGAQEVRCV